MVLLGDEFLERYEGWVWGNLGVIKLGELGIGWKFMVLTGWLRDRKSKVLYILKGLNRG